MRSQTLAATQINQLTSANLTNNGETTVKNADKTPIARLGGLAGGIIGGNGGVPKGEANMNNNYNNAATTSGN